MVTPPWGPPPFERFRQEMERWADALRTQGERAVSAVASVGAGQPPVDMVDYEDRLEISVDVPGAALSEVRVELSGAMLTIHVARTISEPAADGRSVLRERSSAPLSRGLSLPAEVAADRVQASLRDGVLTVIVPKAVGPAPRIIPISQQS